MTKISLWNHTHHPLAKLFSDLCGQIEMLGASVELTNTLTAVQNLRKSVENEINRKHVALQECADYFERRSDADCDQDGFIPNEEMKLLSIVEEALAKAEGQP